MHPGTCSAFDTLSPWTFPDVSSRHLSSARMKWLGCLLLEPRRSQRIKRWRLRDWPSSVRTLAWTLSAGDLAKAPIFATDCIKHGPCVRKPSVSPRCSLRPTACAYEGAPRRCLPQASTACWSSIRTSACCQQTLSWMSPSITAFAAQAGNRFELHSEFLDVARFPGEEQRQRQADFFAGNIASVRPTW